MKWEVKNEKACRKAIDVTVEKEYVSKIREGVLKEIKNNAQVDGYRKGKAPETVVRNVFGRTIEEETQKELIPKVVSDVLSQVNLHLVTYPRISNIKYADDGGMSLTIIAETNAEFELKDYKNLKIDKKTLKEVTDEDVERELGKIRQSRGVLKDSGRDTAADGDFAEVTIIGFVDGKSEDSLTSPNDMIRIGSKASPEGLEEGLKGMKIGQEKDIKVKFPADFGDAKLAGKQADLKVTLKALKTLDVPELNDDFVKGLGAKFTTVVELKDAIRAELKKQAETAARNHNIDAVFSELLKANVFDVAEGLVIQETDAIMSRYESQLANQGLNIEKLGLNRAEVRKKYAKAAEDNVRLRYILRKVAEAEKIEVTDADVEAEIRKIAESTKEDADAMLKRAKQSWDALKAQYLEDKVIERLLELAK